VTAIVDSLCAELRNFFVRSVIPGTYSIGGGALLPSDGLPAPADGQFYCIHGSLFNDGVHRYPEGPLVDEDFTGEIWLMAVPPGFLALAEDVALYRSKVDEMTAKNGGYASESFDGYSYTLPTGATQDLVELDARIKAGKRRYRKL
jgi:hypothetical protein